jgi:hypothetical protein
MSRSVDRAVKVNIMGRGREDVAILTKLRVSDTRRFCAARMRCHKKRCSSNESFPFLNVFRIRPPLRSTEAGADLRL